MLNSSFCRIFFGGGFSSDLLLRSPVLPLIEGGILKRFYRGKTSKLSKKYK